MSSRLKYKDHFDGGQLIDSRERRQIIGEFTLDPADFMYERRFPDTICVASSNFDTHGYTIHPLFMVKPPHHDRLWVDVPYRCLLPQQLDGVLVTGLGVSAHRDALPVIRMQPDVQNQGYAAGLAAAWASKQNVSLRELDIKALQQALVEKGNLPERVLTDVDSFPVSDEVLQEAIDEQWDEFAGLSIIFYEAERALPLVKVAYENTEAADQKLRYAHILALLGNDSGVHALLDHVEVNGWDEGWNYRGMGQFGMSMSEMDAIIIALAGVSGEAAWPAVIAKIQSLGDDPVFSHCRAVAIACEKLHTVSPNEEAVAALADVLKLDGFSGHAQTTIEAVQAALTNDGCETTVRNVALREIHIARALYRCGDYAGQGEATLKRYAEDLRGHFARHAHATLASTSQLEPVV